jgi:hypothetical protein
LKVETFIGEVSRAPADKERQVAKVLGGQADAKSFGCKGLRAGQERWRYHDP